MRSVRRGLTLLSLLLGLGGASNARAWADADVRTMEIAADVRNDGRATFVYNVECEVRGGWLSELELPGLGAHAALDTFKSAWALGDDGIKRTPSVEFDEQNVVHVRFAAGDAPRRGRVQIGFVFDADIPVDANAPQFRWTLAPWRAGLDGVRVHLNLPERVRLINDEAGGALIEAAQTSLDDRTVIDLSRAHLPRDTEWVIALDRANAPVIRAATQAARAPMPNAHDKGVLGALVVGVLALGVLKRFFARRNARAQHLISVPFSPLPSAVLPLASLGLAGASITAPTMALPLLISSVAIAALSFVDRTPKRGAAFTHAISTHPVHALAWLDATRPAGALASLLLTLTAVHFAAHVQWSELAMTLRLLPLLAAPLMLTSTRWSRPLTSAQSARVLTQFARDEQLTGVLTNNGFALQTPQIAGCERATLHTISERASHGYASRIVCTVQVAVGSRANAALIGAFENAPVQVDAQAEYATFTFDAAQIEHVLRVLQPDYDTRDTLEHIDALVPAE